MASEPIGASSEKKYLDKTGLAYFWSKLKTLLSGKQSTVTGGASTITSSNLTTSRALVSNSNGKVAVSAVTSAELGYLDGVNSNIQNQLNSKMALNPNNIELYGNSSVETPYIDFHYAGDTGDYTSRIIEFANSSLQLESNSIYITSLKSSSVQPLVADESGKITKSNLLDLIHPIGSIYTSTKSTSPATLFGGSWTRIKDRFLLCAGDTYTAGSTGGSSTVTLTESQLPKITPTFTGTAASHTHTFTGTAASHTHTFTGTAASHYHGISGGNSIIQTSSGSVKGIGSGSLWVEGLTVTDRTTTTSITPKGTNSSTSITPKGTNSSTSITPSGTISSFGSGSSHNNMPPYKVVYAWERTA